MGKEGEMLSQKVLEAWIQRIEENASARISGNAQDITELAPRIEKLEGGVSLLETIMELHSQRLPDLSLADTQAKCHTAEHKALAERIEQLEKSPAGLWADLEENIELGHRLAKLKEQVEQLERLLERED